MAEPLPAADDATGGGAPRFVWLYRLCLASAALGGFAAFATAAMVTLSVVMRVLGYGGIRGDFEAVELVCAACASLFLPLCQFTRGHVMVDLFTGWMAEQSQRRLDGVWTLLFAFAWAVLSWRLTHGLLTLQGYGDRTMLLGFPIWTVYIPAVFGTALSALVALVTGLDDIRSRARRPAETA